MVLLYMFNYVQIEGTLCFFFSGLEKSVKDLHRQTVALERFRMILNEEVDKTYKRIKSVFEEVRTRYV